MSVFGRGVGRICAVAAASTAAEMRAQVRAALRETPTVELRLDWLRSDAEREKFLSWLMADRGEREGQPGLGSRGPGGAKARRLQGGNTLDRAVFIATCRRREGGGKFAGSVAAEMGWLAQAAEAGCAWCDVEVESARGLALKRARKDPPSKTEGGAPGRAPARILLSVHDFRRTPRFQGRLQLPRENDADAVKIAAQARTIGDSVRLLRVARDSKDRVIVPMGEVGLPGRLLALREGSALAYAPMAQATAPGQVSLWEMKHLYRAHKLNRQTRVYGVIGNPVGHSLSPLLHNTGFITAKTNAVYVPFLVENLRDFLRAAPEFGVRGFSVTLPHKQSVLRQLDECEALAAEIGAVNTVVVRGDGSLYGCNTDYVGVLRALGKKLRIAGSRVLIFGAGGAARAAAFALTRAGAAVAICARRESAARELARAVGGEVVARRALRTETFDAIVNATPIGMHPREETSPLAAGELHCRVVMDLIYRPERTKLLKIAASRGIATVSGVEMFVAQGIAQWELWMRRRAPEAAMRRAVVDALRAEAKGRRSR